MGFHPVWGKPAMVPDAWLDNRGALQWRGMTARKARDGRSNTGWWQPSQDVRLGAGVAIAVAQKKKAPGKAYLATSAPATTFTGASDSDECA